MEVKVELSKFKVKSGKAKRVDEWMHFLNEHMEDVLLTLKDEKMHVETIFRECHEGQEYLYWYSIQGEGGVSVEDSQHDVDKKHLEFWAECIDESGSPIDMETEVVMIPDNIRKAFGKL
ncbi:hypothetical protein JOD43_000111 [Pullulanibacillus pueri]|uniref:Uncharacterized protein n=1 Tax=Pullulanibacillus pueri TaxID=1437324 RepID=A0A8J3EK10_9BACL|nr:DUF6176 family protein [Pullulanibacillus pueri]MBM7679952.1 hypothetical protein [Pullulanibacillus pueri]GGH73646.1 hypothetical protein GCM10007096_01080 [Pullulanibacillus pueri]